MEAHMADIKTLRETMANIATEARSKLSEVTNDTPEERAAEIEREFDVMMASAEKLQDRIDREERSAALMAKLQQPDTSKIPVVEDRIAPAVDNGLVMDYRTAFAEMISAGGDAYVDAEVRSVLKEYRVQTGGTNSAGGFTVPTELATFVEESMAATGPMYTSNLFSAINSADGRTFSIPTVDDTAVTAVAHGEGVQPTDDGGKDATFGQKSVGAFAFDS